MQEFEARRRPWPGPRPYKESEWEIFFGRTKEIDDVENRISGERLTVLTGGSGTGKTSLLRAGIVPRLRLRRYDEGEKTTWPVLVLREWGAGRYFTFDELARAELRCAVEAIGRWSWGQNAALEDFERLQPIVRDFSGGGNLIEHVRRLLSVDQRSMGGLIIVVDQLEEILRLGEGVTTETTAFLRELLESEKRVRLLLSLRQEHLYELRDLEKSVGGLLSVA